MQKLQNKLLALAGVAILALVGSLMSSRQTTAQAAATAGSAPVTIVGPLPVPVVGSSTVSGTVAATQSGAWNVGITGAPTVRNIDERGRTPYQKLISGSDPVLPKVPAGKRLVIENLSVQTISSNIVGGYVRMVIASAGNGLDYAFPMTYVGTRAGVGNFAVGNFTVRAYVDPTDTVQFLGENGFGTISYFVVDVSGYLVDCSAANSCAADAF